MGNSLALYIGNKINTGSEVDKTGFADASIWSYDFATKSLAKIFKTDPILFDDLVGGIAVAGSICALTEEIAWQLVQKSVIKNLLLLEISSDA
jgi:hypothetical protein